MARRFTPATLVAIGVLSASAVLAGCTGQPTPTSTPTPTPTPTPVFYITAGECLAEFDFDDPAAITQVKSVVCEETHGWQVAQVIALGDDNYPGSAGLGERAVTECATAFKEFIGVDVAYSRYSSAYLAPDATAWDNPGDRKLVCLAGDPEGGLTGSIKGDSSIFPQVGQCTGPQDVPLGKLSTMSCSEKHSFEIYAQKKITQKKAPTTAKINQLVKEVCVAEFKKFVGVTLGKSRYGYTWFIAPGADWTKVADHRIVCSVGLAKGGITGTLKNVKK